MLAASELGLEGRRLLGGHSLQDLVEAIEHRAAADLIGDSRRLRVIDRLAVYLGRQVNRDVIAGLSGPIGRPQGGKPLS